MDADQPREPLNDLDVDREIRSLLAVDPSPELVARVRTRLAAEPEPHAWWWSWKFALPVVAAALIFIAVLLSRPRPIEPAPTLTASALPNTTTTIAIEPYVVSAFRRTDADTGPAKAGHYVRPGYVRPGEAIAASDQEVLLDPRETAALRALIRGVRRGDVDLAAVLRASTPSAMELPPVSEIVIAPITIAPIAEEGVRQ